jgi:hypothetical protein
MSGFSKKLEVIGFANESTPGTAETVVSADADVRVSNIQYTPDFQQDETSREVANGEHGSEGTVTGANSAQISFSVKLTWGGAVATEPNYAKMLASCGIKPRVYTTTGVGYEPLKEYDNKTSTIYYEYAEIGSAAPTIKRIILSGCIGNCVITCAGIGMATYLNFTFTGKFISETDVVYASRLVPTGVSTVPSETFKDAPVSILGVSGQKISTYSLDFGNTIEPCWNQGDASGYDYFEIVRRDPTLSMNPYQTTVASNDYTGKMQAGTEGGTTIAYGSVSPHFTIEVPISQAIGMGASEREGKQAWDIVLDCQRNGTATANMTAEATWQLLQGARA